MSRYKDVVILIPTLNPDDRLISYVDDLINAGVTDIIIVNDGSKKECNNIFNELEQKLQCKVLKHAINQGKGRALKTGFNYFLNTYNDKIGVITADSDGQHSTKDIIRMIEEFKQNSGNLILGARDFNASNVPLKSKFGNKITALIYHGLYGKKVLDTQTGLRGIPTDVIIDIITLDGERFEYEINMLIAITKNKVDIKEVIIDTIYINDNRETHFKPVIDSIKIYGILFNMFLKFSFSGIFSALLDIGIFAILVKFIINGSMQEKILYGTIIARIMSSFVNFLLNNNIVFENDRNNKFIYLLKYYILCIIQMCMSWLLVKTFYDITQIEEVSIKVIVDFCLFMISFQIQSRLIFNKKKNIKEKSYDTTDDNIYDTVLR